MSHPLNCLFEEETGPDPWVLFGRWYRDAEEANIVEPSAMTLATATAEGVPSARMVLMRGFDERGIVFFTHYQGRKGRELAQNPRAALTFFWAVLQRQVRLEGAVEKVPAAESDAYFQSRPRGHRLGAWASLQSEVIGDRLILEREISQLELEYAGRDVPRPPNWGGYRVLPSSIEFWQGRPNRLHDRLLFQAQADGCWSRQRLAP